MSAVEPLPSDTEWHGWRKGDVSLHVGYLPGRKSPCLYLSTRGLISVQAYFRSEEDARRCLRWLDGGLTADEVIAEVMRRPS